MTHAQPSAGRIRLAAWLMAGLGIASPVMADGPFLFLPTIVSFPSSHAPTSILAGDLDLDGDVDLVVTGRGEDDVIYVLLNDEGVFGTPTPIEIGSQTDDVAMGDVDGDGNPDLVVAVRSLRGRLAILLGRGNGSFETPVELSLGREPRGVLVRDFDGDGDLDLVGLNHREPEVEILLNDGTGEFDRAPSVLVGGSAIGIPFPQAIGAEDFDGDGDLDLAVVCTGESRVNFVRNRGDATFEPSEGWRPVRVDGEVGGMSDLAIGDLDLDGRPDVAVPLILIGSVSHLGVFTNQEDPERLRFGQEVAAPATDLSGYAFTIALGDLDGDGDLDAISGQAIPGPLTVLDNRTVPVSAGGDGTIVFESPQVIANDNFFRSIATADVDGDCDVDVLAIDLISNAIWILRNETPQEVDCNGRRRPRLASRPAAPSPVGPISPADPARVPFDVDRDGDVDGADVALLLGNRGAGPVVDPESNP
ncbi:MAG: VCBS repeat-containing protein [Phycisphaera sp.]|nr:VCBS repeat-containing protein [Phycisphaera sp.]